MVGRRRKEKAGDIFKRSQLVFATQATFAEAFPSVAHAGIEVTETANGKSRTLRFTEVNAREFVDCSNRACFGGGVSVGAVLREMIVSQSTEATQRHMCRGYEGSRRRRTGDCRHAFTVQASLEYRETTIDESVELAGVRQIPWPAPSRAAMAYLASRSC